MFDLRRRLLSGVFWLVWWSTQPRDPRYGRPRQRGAVTVEYVVLLSTVAVGLALAVVGLGVPLVRAYLEQTAVLALPVP